MNLKLKGQHRTTTSRNKDEEVENQTKLRSITLNSLLYSQENLK